MLNSISNPNPSITKPLAADNYHDISGLQSIKSLAKDDADAALKQVAKQFESYFMREMLKSMRQANDVLAQGNYLNSKDSQFYRDMFDDQMALSLSGISNIGIADAFYQQLNRNYSEHVRPQPEDGSANVMAAIEQTKGADALSNIIQPLNPSSKQAAFESPQQFVATLLPQAQQAAQQLGVDAKLLIAQAALETGWGRHMIHDQQANNSFNLFGIKAGGNWQGDSVEVQTHEFIDDEARAEQANFRQYANYQQSFNDYVQFLQQPRYAQVRRAGNDAVAFTDALQQAGYATDPSYAEKIQRIYHSDTLNQITNHASQYAVLQERK